jgi:hypothetical protein
LYEDDKKDINLIDVYSNKKLKLPLNHAYSIKNINGNIVEIINPHDSSKKIYLQIDDVIKYFDVLYT